MKALFASLIFVISTVSFADVMAMKGKDAVNLCSAIRDLYILQNEGLSQFPLAQVVRVKVEGPQKFSLVLGNEDEYVSCETANLKHSTSGNTQDTVKIVYNPEVSLVEATRALTGWSYAKAYNIAGSLAENICAQLEMFNVAEDQAQITARAQALFTYTTPDAKNIFGLVPSVSADKAYSCGTLEDEKVFQIPSVEGW